MMIELNRDDLINLLKLTLARVNELEEIISKLESRLREPEELEEIISKDEGWDVNPKFKHSPYPPDWPYGQKSKKTLKDVFSYGVEPGDYES